MSSSLAPGRTIFRREAVERHLQGREEAVLPRFVRPRTFRILWILVGLALLTVVLAWSIRVPVYARGTAVVLSPVGRPSLEALGLPGLALVAFVPPNADGSLVTLGSELFLTWGPSGARVPARIASRGGGVRSPAELRASLVWNDASAAAALTGPCAMVVAHAPPPPPGLAAEQLLGSVCDVELQVGERRVLSMLPWLGGWFETR